MRPGQAWSWGRTFLGVVPIIFIGTLFAWPVGNIVALGASAEGLKAFADGRLWEVAWFTFWQALASTAVTLAVALPGAWALSQRRFPGRALVRALVTVPFVLPTVVVASAFLALADAGAGRWASSGIAAILVAHAFFNYAVVVRVVGAFWSLIPSEVDDTARLLGSTGASRFWRLTLPLLRPALGAAAAIVFLFSFTSFGVVLILGGAGRSTLEVEVYRRTAQLLDLPAASAAAVLQMLAVLAVLAFAARLQARASVSFSFVTPAGSRERPRAPRWRVPAALTPAAVLLGAPVVALVSLAFSNRNGPGLANFRALGTSRQGSTLFVSPVEAVLNSLVIGLTAASVALFIGGCAAVSLAGNGRGLRRGFLEAFVMLPLGTSAVTLGFGLLIAFDTPPFDLRSSIVLVPLAHALVGIPLVVRTLVPALRAIPSRLQESAATLGATPARIRARVDFPLVARAGLVASGLAYAVSLGEFGATSFLSRPDRPTVPIAIFRFLGQPGELNRGQALALSVVLMGMVAAVVLTADLIAERSRF